MDCEKGVVKQLLKMHEKCKTRFSCINQGSEGKCPFKGLCDQLILEGGLPSNWSNNFISFLKTYK